MNRLFEGTGTRAGSEYPLLNVWSNNDEVVVTAELPGVAPADLDIQVVRDQLTLSGERKAEEPSDDVVCHRSERGSGRFARTVRLPFVVEQEKVSAKYEKGVLTITLPRSEVTKPKTIQIEAA
jgi:HSP20 family protein